MRASILAVFVRSLDDGLAHVPGHQQHRLPVDVKKVPCISVVQIGQMTLQRSGKATYAYSRNSLLHASQKLLDINSTASDSLPLPTLLPSFAN